MNMPVNQYLPSLSEPCVTAVNDWLLKRSNLRASVASGELELQWSDEEFSTPLVFIKFRFLEHSWAIALQTLTAIDARLHGEPFMLMPETIRTFTLQKIINEFLNCVSPGIARNIESVKVEWSPINELESWQKFPFDFTNVTQGTQTKALLFVETPDTLTWFTKHLPFAEPTKSGLGKSLSIQTRLELGSTRVHLSELKKLGLDDLIWIEKVQHHSKGLQVSFAVRTSKFATEVQAYWKGSRLTVMQQSNRTDILNKNNEHFSEHSPMQIEIDQLELPISFDLGELSFPLSDIERIAPEYVFELPFEAADAPVNLRIHGKLIAQGSLVTVGRRLAVRVTKICTTETSELTEGISEGN